MNIKEIKTITIDGDDEIFNGKIYNANYRNNLGESPSVLTVSVINEDGEYLIPDLTLDNFSDPYEVKIEDMNFTGNFYLVKTRSSIDQGGKVLQLTFWDESFYLDKIYIGLNKKHGIIPKNTNNIEDIKGLKNGIRDSKKTRLEKFKKNEDIDPYYIQKDEDNNITPLIIIGREFHPCDTNKDGYIDLEEKIFKKDGCDPCPSCPEEKYSTLLDRQKCLDLECSEIFEVKYNFKSLKEAVKDFFKQSGINIVVDEESLPEDFDTIMNEEYYADYEGVLREVLQRWCADFGINFYTEHEENGDLTLKFLDAKVELDIIKIEDIKNNDIIEFDEEQSIENTENRGSVSLYKQQGERKRYECQQNIKLNLRPIVLSDLFSSAKEAAIGKEDEDVGGVLSFEDLEVSMALGKYSIGMRDHFWWGKIYGADRDRNSITKLMYLGPPENRGTSGGQISFVEEGGQAAPSLGKLEKVSIAKSEGLEKSGGISSVNESYQQKIASEEGILELGALKPLAFFFPIGRNGEDSEIYYNKSTAFGESQGKFVDKSAKIVNAIKEFWNPSDEELEFFSNTPLFGRNAFNPNESGEVTIRQFSRGYFMLASRKEDLYEKILENERNLSESFIGKFFAKTIDVEDKLNMCFVDKDKKRNLNEAEITVDGGGTFYHFEDEQTKKFLEDEIFSFGHSESSRIGKLQTKIENKKIDENKEYDEGFIIQKVDNSWFPRDTRIKEVGQIINVYENKKFKVIGSVEDFVEIRNMVANYAPEHSQDPNVKLFVVYPDDFSEGFNIERDIEHPVHMGSDLSRNSRKEFGCYGDCENNDECFSGETDPQRISELQDQLSKLNNEDSDLGRLIKRELGGDTCKDNRCIGPNQCIQKEDCGNWITIGRSTFSDYECIDGECVPRLGLQSPICTKIEVNGFKIFSPPHGFEMPRNKIIINDNFDAKSYGVILKYKRVQEVFVPKIEYIIQENIEKFDKEYAKFNINLYQMPIEDLKIFKEDFCEPDESILEELHEKFNKDLTFNISSPKKILNVSVAGVLTDSTKKINAENGLESFSINISSDKVTTDYVFSNKIAQPISIDLTKRILDVLKKRDRRYRRFRDYDKIIKQAE